MKNINFKATLISFVVAFVIAFAFTACGGGETATEEAASDVVPAADVVAAEQAANDTVAVEEAEDTEEATEEPTE